LPEDGSGIKSAFFPVFCFLNTSQQCQ